MDTDCCQGPGHRSGYHKNPSDASLSFMNSAFNQMSNFQGFDMNQSNAAPNFMQFSFSSSDNLSSPSTPMSLMLNQQHHNSPTSPSVAPPGQFRQIQALSSQMIHGKANPLLAGAGRYANESEEEEDFINWENLL